MKVFWNEDSTIAIPAGEVTKFDITKMSFNPQENKWVVRAFTNNGIQATILKSFNSKVEAVTWLSNQLLAG